jgi:hypothetical protein
MLAQCGLQHLAGLVLGQCREEDVGPRALEPGDVAEDWGPAGVFALAAALAVLAAAIALAVRPPRYRSATTP